MNIKEIIEDIKILYINLDRAVERKNKIEEILNENKLSWTRISAIDGKDLNVSELKKIYNFRKMSICEVACVLSHIKAIQYALDNNYKNVLIIEDDCSFEYLKFKNITLKQLMEKNNSWEIIQLGIICDNQLFDELVCQININNGLLKSCYYSLGTVAYIINRKGMEKILNYFANTKKIKIADEYIYELTNTFITYPYFTQYCNEFKSYIRDDLSLSFQNKSKELWDDFYIKN